MKKVKFIIGDAGTYMMDVVESTTRWCIRHPKDSYSQNLSGRYDCYVVGLIEGFSKDVKYLNSFKNLKEAKDFLVKLFYSHQDFYSLTAKENTFYTKNYYWK